MIEIMKQWNRELFGFVFRVLVFLVFLVPGIDQSVAEELTQAQIDDIETIVATAMQKAPYPGAVVMVNKGGENLYAVAHGFADLENQVPATLESVFAMGSITKSFTALATLQLVEKGALSLDDKVSSILPELQGPAAEVTVRQLLTHTSGIPNYLNEIPGVRGTFERRAVTREQMVGYFATEPLKFEPGSHWSYSNSGYFLLGVIIEQVSGQDYYTYLQEHVLGPLQLKSISSGDDSMLVPHRAHGYRYADGQYKNASPWHYLAPFSAGSLLSNAADLVAYRRAVFKSDLVSPELLGMVTSTSKLADGTEIQYTLGALISSDFQGHRKYAHSGEIYGYFSDHAYYPDDDLTIVILTNNKGTSPSPIWMEHKIARVVLQIAQPEIVQLSLSDEALQQYAGDYRVGPVLFGPEIYSFVVADGQLNLSFGGSDSGAPLMPLLAQGEGAFVMTSDDEWRFNFSQKGSELQQFEMQVRDATITGRRVSTHVD